MRAADYDRIAGGYDRRYSLHAYSGVRDTLRRFVDSAASVLEVGCGTGHWLAELTPADPPPADGDPRRVVGIEPSSAMIARAQAAAPRALLVRASADPLPCRDAAFDRVYCVNALHHFADRARFFAEARRVLRPGGALLSIGKDPHAERDSWWVYDYFPETLEIDRQRLARVRTLRGELALAGFEWAESYECDRIEALTPAREALDTGVVDRAYTSQLAVLTDAELAAGVARVREADAASGGRLQLVTDFYLFATVGWV